MSQPAFSVIMPVYNVAPWLREAVDSVLAQTCQDFELICVNDGSTDESLAILDDLSAQDPRVRVLSQPNAGQGTARNAGLAIARGRYIYFMDGDDTIDPSLLGTALAACDGQGLDLFVFGADVETEADSGVFQPSYGRAGLPDSVTTGTSLGLEMKRKGCWYVSVCLFVASRELYFQPVGDSDLDIRFLQGHIHEDEAFTPLVFAAAQRALCLDKAFYHRRVRAGSTMTTLSSHKSVQAYWVCRQYLAEYLPAFAAKDAQELLRSCIDSLTGMCMRTWQNPRAFAEYVSPDSAEGRREAEALFQSREMTFAQLKILVRRALSLGRKKQLVVDAGSAAAVRDARRGEAGQ